MTTHSSRQRKPSHTVIKAINAFAKSTARSHTALERTAQVHHTEIADMVLQQLHEYGVQGYDSMLKLKHLTALLRITEHNLHSPAYKTIACEVALTARRGL